MQGGRQPGPDHPITVEPASKRVRVHLGDTVLADSTNALILREANLPAVYYIPRSEVAMRWLTSSATSTYCPYKGDASYFGMAPGGAKDVAWSYETPFDHMAMIKDYIAFYSVRVDAIEVSPLP